MQPTRLVMSLIGVFHFIHAPLLIVYPFVISSSDWDFAYIQYFFLIMYAYTFYNGECPISFYYKKRANPYYVAGSRITDYDEMYTICKDRTFVKKYIATTTSLYGGALLYTMRRIHITPAFTVWAALVVLIYTSAIHEVYFKRAHQLFTVVQLLCRVCFVFSIFFIRVYVD